MSHRETYLRIVDEKDVDTTLFAPLTDSLFAASFAGKKWVSQATLDDEIAAAEACGYAGAFVTGSVPDLSCNPALAGLVETELVSESADERRWEQHLATPVGDLTRQLLEQPGAGLTVTGEWITDHSQLKVANWLSEELLAGHRDQAIRTAFAQRVQTCRPHGVTQVQLELPFFLYALPGFATGPVMMAMDASSGYAEAMDLAGRALQRVAGVLVEAGVDFIWIGAGGTELLSPTLWEQIVIPQSRAMIDAVRRVGGRAHFHCCGQSGLWIERGYFNEIAPDVLETLSPPPTGTIEDLAAARSQLDPRIVTRGNIDLELLRSGPVDECIAAARRVAEQTRNFPHLVGAADAILYGTPPATLRAVAEACRDAVG